jgi:hypothetical protein
VIPEGITAIGHAAFFTGLDDLRSVTFPSTLVSIDGYAFSNCGGITSVDFPPSLVSIGNTAFFGAGLSTVSIPATLTSVGPIAFGGEYLTAINAVPNHPVYSSVDGVFFDKEKSVLMLYPGGKTAESYTIPSSVTRIEIGAFAFNIRLTSLYVNATIPPNAGEEVFYGVNTSACTLYVPTGTKAAYQTAETWKEFGNITEYDPTGITLPAAQKVFTNSSGGVLTVNSPVAEQITVYSVNGALLLRAQKAAGEARFNLSGLPRGVLIVKGGSGWTRKTVR